LEQKLIITKCRLFFEGITITVLL